MFWNIVGTIIFGAVIGVLARLVLPGKQAMGWVITVVLGIAGALIGYWVWNGLLGKGDTSGIDWIRWVISIAAAAVLALGYQAISRGMDHSGHARHA
ncbi:GlsB/YeaQ/YmgE family stress response membrane protein [Rhodococcus sp. NPDC004095]